MKLKVVFNKVRFYVRLKLLSRNVFKKTCLRRFAFIRRRIFAKFFGLAFRSDALRGLEPFFPFAGLERILNQYMGNGKVGTKDL